MLLSTANAQVITTDSTAFSTDTLVSENALEQQVVSFAEDSIDYDLANKKVYLYHNAWVKYGEITLKAAFIELDSEKNIVYATGLPDSTGEMYGYPVFSEKGKDFSSKEMTYNFKTKKGVITEIITKEGEGYIHGEKVKKQANDVVHTHEGKYTTCDAEEPHFAIRAKKIKTIPGKKIITGPANLEIAGIPTPLVVPFGFFPNQQKQSSGLIFPSYGESASLGFFLKNGGYYFALNEYVDLGIRGDIYTKGSWGLSAHSNYRKRYKYNGHLKLSYSSIKTGSDDLGNLEDKRDFFIDWKHNQDQKARPNSRFAASVNAGSSTYHKNTVNTNNDYLKNTYKSSISYSKSWDKSNFSSSLGHSQNTLNNTIHLDLPEVSYNINKLHPFKMLNKGNKSKWYDKIGVSYRLNARNEINTIDSLLFTQATLDKFENGIKHYIPVSASFKTLKHFTVSPSFNYTERWYFNHLERSWNGTDVTTDTIKGFDRVYNYNFKTSINTKIYGMLQFKKGKVKALRHVISPALSFNYQPDFSTENFGYYQEIQSDSLGNTQPYSMFQNGIYGSVPIRRSGDLSFSLGNILEMKVNNKKDTVETIKKIKLLENLKISSAYNLFADSMNLSAIYLSGRTKLFNLFDLNFSSSFDPYSLNDSGERINQYYFKDSYKLGRLTDIYASLNFGLNGGENKEENHAYYWMDYVDFDIPWSLNVNYNIDYSKPKFEKTITQYLGFSGSVKLTDKWKIGFNSGYDFKERDLTHTTLNIYRDLHCWEMLFKWIPFGHQQSYNFTIRVKASTLQDLKWEKKKDWYDY